MQNLFKSQIEFSLDTENSSAWQDFKVTTKGEVWWDFYSDGDYLFDSWVELGEHFFEALLKGPVPLSTRALRELKNSSLALDLYSWSAYATFTAMKRGEPFRITWAKLHQNLGADYSRVRDFKKWASLALEKVVEVYPELRLEERGDELWVKPSFPSVKQRTRRRLAEYS